MGHHTFDASRANKLERAERRYRFLSAEELLWALDLSSDETVVDLAALDLENRPGVSAERLAPHVH